jgi:hypothetical protein
MSAVLCQLKASWTGKKRGRELKEKIKREDKSKKKQKVGPPLLDVPLIVAPQQPPPPVAAASDGQSDLND